MADQKSNIVFGADLSGFTGPLEQYLTGLARQSQRIKEITSELVKHNTTAGTAIVQLRGMTESGQKFAATFRDSAKGVEILNAQLSQVIKKTKEQKDAQDAQARNARALQSQQLIPGALKDIGFDPSKLNPAQLNTARNAVNNLNNAFIQGRVTAAQLQQAIVAVNTGSLTPLTGGAAIAAGQLGTLNNVMKQTNQTINLSIDSIARLAIVFGFRQILIGLISEFKNAIVESFNFDTALTKLKVTSDTINLGRLSNEINTLSKEFGVSRADLAAAQLEIYKNTVGSSVTQTQTLNDAIKLGEITFTSTNEAAKTLSETIRIFGLSLNDSSDIANKLFVGTRIGRTDLKEIDQLFERVGSTAKTLGVSFEEVLAAFSVLRARGTSASEATSQLNGIFGKLKEGTPELNKLLQENGFVTGEQAVQTLKLSGVLDLLAKAAEKNNEAFTDFGKGLRFFKGESQLALGADQFKDFITQLDKAGEASKNASKTIDESLNKTLDRAKEKVKAFGQALADSGIQVLAGYAILLGLNERNAEKATEETKKKIDELNNGASSSTQKALDNTLTAYNNFFQKVGIGLNKQLTDTISKQRDIADSFKIASEGTIDVIKGSIGDISREITDAQSAIKTSQKAIFDDASKFERESFDRRLKLLTPQEQIRSIDPRIAQLTAQGTQLFGGGPEDIRQGRERFKEAEALILKEIDLQNQLGRTKARQETEIQRIQESANREIAKAFDSESRRTSASSARIREEQNHLTRVEAAGKNQAARDQEAIRHAIQLNQIKESEQPNRAGDISEAASARLANINQQINNLIAQRGPFLQAGAAAQLRGLQLTQQQLALELQAQVNLAKRKEDLEKEKASEIERLRAIQLIFKEVEQPVFDKDGKLKKGFQSTQQAADEFAKKTEQLNQLLTRDDIAKNPNLIFEFEKLKQNKLAEIDIRAKAEELVREQQQTEKIISERKKRIEAQQGTISSDVNKAIQDVKDIQKQVGTESQFIPTTANTRNIQDTIASLGRALSGTDFTPESLNGIKRLFDQLKNIPGEKTFSGNDLAVFQSNINALGSSINKLSLDLNIKDRIDASSTELNNKLKQLTDNIDTNKFLTLSNGTARAGFAVSALAGALENAATRINNVIIAGEPGQKKADGGLITAGTGPRSDDVPVWLSKGEYVVNAASTRKFYSQIQAINAGRFADGGLVGSTSTTNVGDINIHVKGGDTSEITLRNIGNGLERALRRGIIRVGR